MEQQIQVIDLRAWCKSPQGVSMIQAQKMFVAVGEIWQGYDQQVMRVDEKQLSEDELENIPDLDNTISQVLFKRAQRLESRYLRKDKEFETRRGQLRGLRNEIRTAIKTDKDLGLDPSPSDIADIKAIDLKAMSILAAKEMNDSVVAKAKLQSAAAAEQVELTIEAAVPVEVNPDHVGLCGKVAPEGHVKPRMWVRGHVMGCPVCKELQASRKG